MGGGCHIEAHCIVHQFHRCDIFQVQSRLFPLPSSRAPSTQAAQPPSKRRRSSACTAKHKIYAKDIVCLPHTPKLPIQIPRGEKRSSLAEMGLVGKISLNAAWSAIEVEREVSSVVKNAFGISDDSLLTYQYLW